MATLDERFQKGLEMRERLAGGQGRLYRGAVPIAYELAPDMYRISTECLYGAIWSRPGLDLRYRAMATLAAATMQLVATQIRSQVRNALNVGIQPEEIIEICMMVAFYGGIPAAYNALGIAKEVFEERGLQVTLPETFNPAVAPDTLYEWGLAKHRELIPDVFGYHPTEPTEEEYALDVLMQEYLWGAVWTRPGLDMKSRVICALATMVVRGQYDLSVRRMIEGALRYGLSKTEIMELAMQLVFYVGILPARAFMHIANTVFRSPEFAQTDGSEVPGKTRGAP
jgi:4-carboxymuconolactone decarboxylase